MLLINLIGNLILSINLNNTKQNKTKNKNLKNMDKPKF